VLLASARTFAAALTISFADATLTLQNTDEEDTDAGRQSRFIVKGEQSGGEVTTLGYLEFSHEGASDDQKGQWKLVVNDGDDDDAPSKTSLVGMSTGKIDASESAAISTDTGLAEDDDDLLASQKAIKAYVDADHPAYSGGESHTDGSGLIIKAGLKEDVAAGVGGSAVEFGTAFPGGLISVVATLIYDVNTSGSCSLGDDPLPSASGFTVLHNVGTAQDVYWMAIGY